MDTDIKNPVLLKKDGTPRKSKGGRPKGTTGIRRRTQPTIKQIKTLVLMNQGKSKRAAMIQSGYKVDVAEKPRREFFKSPAVQAMIQSMASELANEGLTVEYMKGKFKEWLEAEKIDHSHTSPDQLVPDYDVQLKAYDKWKKIMDEHNQGVMGNNGLGKVKRKLTIEEFVSDSEQQQG